MNKKLFAEAITEGFISVIKDKAVEFIKNNLPSVIVTTFGTLLSIGIIALITMSSVQKIHTDDIADNSKDIKQVANNNLTTTEILTEVATQQRVNTSNIRDIINNQKELTQKIEKLTQQITELSTKSQSDVHYQSIVIENAIQNIKDKVYEIKINGEEVNEKILNQIQEIEKRLYLLEIEIRKLETNLNTHDKKLKPLSKGNKVILNPQDLPK